MRVCLYVYVSGQGVDRGDKKKQRCFDFDAKKKQTMMCGGVAVGRCRSSLRFYAVTEEGKRKRRRCFRRVYI